MSRPRGGTVAGIPTVQTLRQFQYMFDEKAKHGYEADMIDRAAQVVCPRAPLG